MNNANTFLTILMTSLLISACAKPNNNAQSEATAVSAPVVEDNISAEQQALIDAIDQPILDDKNTDVPAEIVNAPADLATPAQNVQVVSSATSP